MEMCPTCRCPRNMRVQEYAGVKNNLYGSSYLIVTTMFHCAACGNFVGSSTRRADQPKEKAEDKNPDTSSWWLSGWQRKWRSEKFATSMTMDHTRDRMWKADERYQQVQGMGKYGIVTKETDR